MIAGESALAAEAVPQSVAMSKPKGNEKKCAFCWRGQKSSLGQGILTRCEPTAGFNPFRKPLKGRQNSTEQESGKRKCRRYSPHSLATYPLLLFPMRVYYVHCHCLLELVSDQRNLKLACGFVIAMLYQSFIIKIGLHHIYLSSTCQALSFSFKT